jgi:hypothetical protein
MGDIIITSNNIFNPALYKSCLFLIYKANYPELQFCLIQSFLSNFLICSK